MPNLVAPSLLVPEYERGIIHAWALDQDWPEGTKLKDPERYHVTIVYCPVDHTSELARKFMYEVNMDNWEFGLRVTGFEQFAYGAAVLTVHSALLAFSVNHYQARARALGLDPRTFGEYRPHVTVAQLSPDETIDHMVTDLPGPDSVLGYPLKFATAQKAVELHTYYDEMKARA
jgi:hypothetical protein